LGHKGLQIDCYDADRVSSSNIGRTSFSHVDVGQYKTDVLSSRVNLFYGLTTRSFPRNFEAEKDYKDYEIIISCVDVIGFRVKMGELAQDLRQDKYQAERLYLDFGNSKSTGQVILGHLSIDHKRESVCLPTVYDLYKDTLLELEKTEENKSSCSLLEAIEIQDLGINDAVCTFGIMSLLFRLLKSGIIKSHGAKIDLEEMEANPYPINEQVWAFMGYQNNLNKDRFLKTLPNQKSA
jgi:PRTRC genetic system ThiF family protein